MADIPASPVIPAGTRLSPGAGTYTKARLMRRPSGRKQSARVSPDSVLCISLHLLDALDDAQLANDGVGTPEHIELTYLFQQKHPAPA